MDNQDGSIEVVAETVDAAVEAGLAQLGVSRDRVQVEVVREGSRGVLGIGARDALVRLTRLAEEVEPSLEPAPAREPEPAPAREPEPEPEPEPTPEPEARPKPTQEEILGLARDILAELMERMQIEADIQARVSEPRYPGDSSSLVLDIQGDDLGFLIGRKGETLAAIQHLLRLMVNKVVQQRVHLVVDVEGYKVRREDALKKLALRIADQATRRRRRIALEPMNAYERRIIHMTLRNHPTVITESVGEGSRRKVTIVPKPL
jgi:spoIIIJ-associated protein